MVRLYEMKQMAEELAGSQSQNTQGVGVLHEMAKYAHEVSLPRTGQELEDLAQKIENTTVELVERIRLAMEVPSKFGKGDDITLRSSRNEIENHLPKIDSLAQDVLYWINYAETLAGDLYAIYGAQHKITFDKNTLWGTLEKLIKTAMELAMQSEKALIAITKQGP